MNRPIKSGTQVVKNLLTINRVLNELISDEKFDRIADLPYLDGGSKSTDASSIKNSLANIELHTFQRELLAGSTVQKIEEEKMDYEKLGCLYELSCISNESGTIVHFEKAIEMIFATIPSIEYAAIFDRPSPRTTNS